jgi:hypothetical protein
VYAALGGILAQCRAPATPALTDTLRGPPRTESDPPASQDTALGKGVSIDKKLGKRKRSAGEVKRGKGVPVQPRRSPRNSYAYIIVRGRTCTPEIL